MSDMDLKPLTKTVYYSKELKSLTRYHFDNIRERAKLKLSVSRLVCILFPELEKLIFSLHMASVYALIDEFPGATQVANLTELKFFLAGASNDRYGLDVALIFQNAARNSIGFAMSAKFIELRHA